MRAGTFVAAACLAVQMSAATTVAAEDPPSRQIRFSGFDWIVKSSTHAVGPGPNVFSDSGESVWVDAGGRLHMSIRYSDGRWWSAEIICTCSPGLGEYTFRIPADGMHDLDANAVLGLFNWSDADAFSHREIDIEVSRWGQAANANAQFVVQPYDRPDHIHRFNLMADAPVALTFSWLADRVRFTAIGDRQDSRFDVEHRADIPPAGGNPRINLWLVDGRMPLSHTDVDIVVESFSFAAP